jgi:hypothetical protein
MEEKRKSVWCFVDGAVANRRELGFGVLVPRLGAGSLTMHALEDLQGCCC